MTDAVSVLNASGPNSIALTTDGCCRLAEPASSQRTSCSSTHRTTAGWLAAKVGNHSGNPFISKVAQPVAFSTSAFVSAFSQTGDALSIAKAVKAISIE